MTKSKNKGQSQNKQKSAPKAKQSAPRNSGSNGPIIRSAPAATFPERRSTFSVSSGPAKYKNSVRISGQDYMGSVQWTSANAVGSTLLNQLICPSNGVFNNTRLQKFAQLYDKYCFTNLRFHVQSANATDSAGSYVLAYDRDPSDPTPPANEDGLRQFLAMEGTRSFANWVSGTIDCQLIDTQDFYYTNASPGGDERLIYQGQLYVAVMQGASGTFNPSISLWVEYDVLLMDPQLELSLPEAVQTTASKTNSISGGEGFNNLTTATAVSNMIPSSVDGNGNRRFTVPQGTWIIEQVGSSVSNFGFDPPSSFDLQTAQSIANTVLDANHTSNAVGASYRLDKITAGPNGASIYGNNIGTAGTVTDQVVRIFQAAQSFL